MSIGILIALACAVLAIVYGAVSTKWVMSLPSGNERMQTIAKAIQQGASAYLNRQYLTIGLVGIILFLVIGFIPALGWPTAIAFAIGAIFSGAAGYIGMNVSVRANVRTAEAARSGLNKALSVAFRGGAITGMLVVGLGLLGIAGYYAILVKIHGNVAGITTYKLIKPLIGLAFGGSLISIFARLGGARDWLIKLKLPKWLALTIIYLLFIGVLLTFLIWLLPLLFQQLGNLFIEIPKILTNGQKFLVKMQAAYPDLFSADQLQTFIGQLNNYLTTLGQFILSYSLSTIGNVITIIVYLVLVPLLVFFFLKDKQSLLNWMGRFLPKENQVIRKIGHEIKAKLGDYVRGKLIEFVIVAVVSILAFMLLGLHYAVLLGIGVGLSVIIPYIGAVIITIPVVLIAFFQWGLSSHFLYLMIVYAIIMLADANILVPFLFSETMKLHPVVIVLAVLVFGSLWGFWGVFFAIPLATVINTLMKQWPRKIEKEK